MADPAQFNALQAFGLAVAGGVTGAALTQLVTIVREWWDLKQRGRHAGLVLALTLEDYASQCSSHAGDIFNWFRSRGASGSKPGVFVPVLADYSEKTDWRAVGIKIADLSMSFRVSVSVARSYLDGFWIQMCDEDEDLVEAGDKSLELGLLALEIADEIRRRKRLHPAKAPEVVPGYDVRRYLLDEMARRSKIRADVAASRAASAAALWATVAPPPSGTGGAQGAAG